MKRSENHSARAIGVMADEAAAELAGLTMTTTRMMIAELLEKVNVNEICKDFLDA